MRINKFIALATGMSRRTADTHINAGVVSINGEVARPGSIVATDDDVVLNGKQVSIRNIQKITIALHKPVGYVVSRNGQGSRTIYDLLPKKYQQLQPIGRLDKDSSGLLLLTNDGQLAQELTHPSKKKIKIYEITLNKPLQPLHRQMISDYGIYLDDGPSRLQLDRLIDDNDKQWRITMSEGRNRQIRRTFATLGYTVTQLHRIQFGEYQLGQLLVRHYQDLPIPHNTTT